MGGWIYSDLHKPVTHAKTGQYIEIPKGSSPSAIVNKLAAEGVIKNEWPLKALLEEHGSGSHVSRQANTISLRQSRRSACLAKLQQGQRRLNRFTIIEGWTRWDIARAMAQVPQFRLYRRSSSIRVNG